MTQQVEVRLSNGGREVFSASAWVGREDGGLDVLSADNSAPLATVATFARGEWAFASKVVVDDQVDEKLSVGNLTIDLNVEGAEALRNSPRPGTFRCVACMVRLPVSDEGPTDSDGDRWCQACAHYEARSQA